MVIRTRFRMDTVSARKLITRFRTADRSHSNLKPREVYKIRGVKVNESLEAEVGQFEIQSRILPVVQSADHLCRVKRVGQTTDDPRHHQ